MARTALTPQTLLGPHPGVPAANALDFTWAAADEVNLNDFPHTGREVILIRNDNVAAQTITLTSKLSGLNRLGTITAYSVGIGEYAALWAGDINGWKQADGNFYLEAAVNDVFFAILRLPN